MTKPKFGLGRGLDALIPGAAEIIAAPVEVVNPRSSSRTKKEPKIEEVVVEVKTGLLEVPIGSIIPNPRQPRHPIIEDEKLQELAGSIKEHGILQPLVVSLLSPADIPARSETDVPRYQLIAGERRWRASHLAGLAVVPVVIKEVSSQQMLELALVENIQRADLNPIEEAFAYQSLIDEYGLTQEAIAERVGKNRTTITNTLRLLHLPAPIREKLAEKMDTFTSGHARALLRIPRQEDQIHAMKQIITQGLSVRQTEELAERLSADTRVIPQRRVRQASPEIAALEEDFRLALMAKVAIRRSRKGKGSVTIFFSNEDELQRIYESVMNTRSAEYVED